MSMRIVQGRSGRVRRTIGGFTLIEVLVVVAIIALLVAILLPSLSKVREQSRRAVCLSHLHQFGIAFSLYSADSNQYLPMSGLPHYKYFMKHDGRRINAGILFDKYAAKELALYFCPSNPLASQGDMVIGSNNYGGSGFLDPNEPHTFMAYIYAIPMNWSEPWESGGTRHPKDAGKRSYPDVDDRGKDGRWMLQEEYRNWLIAKRAFKGEPNYGNHHVAALMADNYIANQGGPGIGQVTHKQGYNVVYTDFHAKWVRESSIPTDAQETNFDPSIALPVGPTSRTSQKNFEAWDYFSRSS